MLFVDPMEPGIRELAAPFLRQAADAGSELTELVLERSRALEAAGYHAQVHVERKARCCSRWKAGGACLSGETAGGANSMQAERLSPNALLRPVMQDFILPTVAYVGGPAELAYLAQSQVLYRALLGRMPVVVHRAGFTLLDARSEKLLRRYGLSVPDVFHGKTRCGSAWRNGWCRNRSNAVSRERRKKQKSGSYGSGGTCWNSIPRWPPPWTPAAGRFFISSPRSRGRSRARR